MWFREDLKDRAKLALRVNGYWKPLLASLLLLLLTGGSGTGNSTNTIYRFSGPGLGPYWEELQRNLPLAAWFWGVLIALGLTYAVLVVGPVTVGWHRYCLEHRARRVPLSALFRPFREEYRNTVRTMLMTDVITFLWSLLFIVPGIVKRYQYFLVPDILAENPKIGWQRAMRLSRDMTRGSKFEIWVMQLSFMGWLMLPLVVIIPLAIWLSGPLGQGFDSLYKQLYALTRGQSSFINWLLNENKVLRLVPGYAGKFIALNLSGLGLYCLDQFSVLRRRATDRPLLSVRVRRPVCDAPRAGACERPGHPGRVARIRLAGRGSAGGIPAAGRAAPRAGRDATPEPAGSNTVTSPPGESTTEPASQQKSAPSGALFMPYSPASAWSAPPSTRKMVQSPSGSAPSER